MISIPDRVRIVELIEEAVAAGARKCKACEALGISLRCVQRWTQGGDEVKADSRAQAQRPEPANKLSEAERAWILVVVNSPEYRDLSPSQIVPALADKGIYLASESTIYRILREAKQLQHRKRSNVAVPRPISTYCATGPNQVWCWDITWLPGPMRGMYYYLYLILDLYSRKVVGWEVYDRESGDFAAELITKACLREKIAAQSLVLHSDNGSPMKASSMLDTLRRLGIIPSFNRARVSNDNAYIESFFGTCKYHSSYPVQGFKEITKARQWVEQFVQWYNYEHKHSGLKFVTPHQCHTGQAAAIMEKRKKVYENAKADHPERWSGRIRNWDLPEEVWLNPERRYHELQTVA